MKHFLCIIFFLSSIVTEISAQNCKAIISQDKFTKDKYVLYGGEFTGGVFDGSTYLSFFVGTKNDALCSFFTLKKVVQKPTTEIITKLRSDSKISKGAKLYLVLDNAETVQVTALSDGYYDESNFLGYSLTTQVVYSLTPEQLSLLATHKITDYRIELNGSLSTLEDKAVSGKAKTLITKFACALSELKYK